MDFQKIIEQANRTLLAGMKAGQEIERLHQAVGKRSPMEWNDRIKTIAVLLDAAERSLRQYGDACGRKSRVAMYQQELDSLRKAQAINS